MNHLHSLDYVVFFIYFIVVSSYGYWVYHQKKSKEMDSKDFFLAEGSLTWWAIGASLIVVAVFFIPIYLKNKIFTMPQFLSRRYNDTVSTLMAIFWLLVYVFVNLTSIIYLGALAINSISGISFEWCMIGLGIFSIVVTLGGMKVIGYTDVIQVLVLIMGGLVTCYLALSLVSERFGFGGDVLKGLSIIKDKAPSHFHMIFDSSNPYYKDLPGLSVLVGGMWINNLNYWGCNQYITQRALGADLKTARSGILFAAFLKLLIPLIVVIPGITMYVMHQNGMFQAEMADVNGVIKPDHSYPTLMNLLPNGLKGLAFAALTAAIVASLAGKANSISTIFSLDIYRKFFNRNASEKKLVATGRITVIISMILACLVVPALRNLDQAYQFVQEYVGFISPGVLSIFLLGFFWKRTTAAAALTSALLTIPLSTIFKFLPSWTNGAFPDIPFMDRMTLVFIILMLLTVVISLLTPKNNDPNKQIIIDTKMFRCSPSFVVGSVIIVGILAALYTVFW